MQVYVTVDNMDNGKHWRDSTLDLAQCASTASGLAPIVFRAASLAGWQAARHGVGSHFTC